MQNQGDVMALKIIIGAAIGLIVGGIIGYIGKCRTGTCPITSNPFSGAVIGALIGAAIGASLGPHRGDHAELYKNVVMISSEQQFEQAVIDSDKPVLVDFYAVWCGPCQVQAPILSNVAERFRGRADVVAIDAEKFRKISAKYSIQAYPTVVLFVGGKEVKRWVGVQDEKAFASALDAVVKKAPTTMTQTKGSENMAPPLETQVDSVKFKGKPLELVGRKIQIGQPAPDFIVVDNNLNEMHLSNFLNGVLVISAVPSLDTATCDMETRRFNEEAGKLGEKVKVLTISMDLPFAQKRWCGANGIEHVQTASDYRYSSFGQNYGVLIKDLRLLARCIFVIDRTGKVRYVQLVKEVADEPNYDAAIKAIKDAM